MSTYLVTNNNGSGLGSLASAIALAEETAEADTITFATGLDAIVTNDTFTLTTKIEIDGDVDNDGTPDVTISGVSGGFFTHQLFRIEPGAEVSFGGLVLTKGRDVAYASAGAVRNFGRLDISNCQFIDNFGRGAHGSDGGSGEVGANGGSAAGAIYNEGQLFIALTDFIGNFADGGEGGKGGDGASGTGTSGRRGGNGGDAAGAILNALGARVTLSAVSFDPNPQVCSTGRGGDGGDGAAGLAIGGRGGNGGNEGHMSFDVLNYGSVTGSAAAQEIGFYRSFGPGVGGNGGTGQLHSGVDGSKGTNGITSNFILSLGTDGNDALTGIAGRDDLYGLAGADRVSGANGNDYLSGGAGSDTLAGGSGGDSLRGDEGNDKLIASFGEDAYRGADGTDEIDFTLFGGGVSIDLRQTARQAILGGGVYLYGDIENAKGTAFADILTGTTDANRLNGSTGNDTLSGAGGSDTLDGGVGADSMIGGTATTLFYVDNAGDKVIDTVGGDADQVMASVSYTLAAAAQIELLATSNAAAAASLNLTGNQYAQKLQGNAGQNILDGQGGADIMAGLGGSDVYRIDNAVDVVDESPGGSDGIDTVTSGNVSLNLGVNNFFKGAVENATLLGNNTLNAFGNGLTNVIVGNAGTNLLDGGLGNDTLRGLGGVDSFRFSTALDALKNVDTIGAYVVADDRIQLDDAIFAGLAIGGLTAGAYFTGAIAHDLDDRIIYNNTTGELFFDADGTKAGGVAAVQFATLTAGLAMGAGEFLVI